MQMVLIIPYQELLGNYDINAVDRGAAHIIPYQELLGNYDVLSSNMMLLAIIPYQELLGNYDCSISYATYSSNYTIPRAIRELWQIQ